jgi:hypothetical protein
MIKTLFSVGCTILEINKQASLQYILDFIACVVQQPTMGFRTQQAKRHEEYFHVALSA